MGKFTLKISIALFALTIALAGGERALGPDSASALITSEGCDEWLECLDDGREWGSEPEQGGGTGSTWDDSDSGYREPDIGPPEDPYGEDDWDNEMGSPEDPYGTDDGSLDSRHPEDPYAEDNSTKSTDKDQDSQAKKTASITGSPEDPYAKPWDPQPVDPNFDRPYRGCLDDGTYYTGPKTAGDLMIFKQLTTPSQDPTKPYRGRLKDGSYYHGVMNEQDLMVTGELNRHRTPCQIPEPSAAPPEPSPAPEPALPESTTPVTSSAPPEPWEAPGRFGERGRAWIVPFR